MNIYGLADEGVSEGSQQGRVFNDRNSAKTLNRNTAASAWLDEAAGENFSVDANLIFSRSGMMDIDDILDPSPLTSHTDFGDRLRQAGMDEQSFQRGTNAEDVLGNGHIHPTRRAGEP